MQARHALSPGKLDGLGLPIFLLASFILSPRDFASENLEKRRGGGTKKKFLFLFTEYQVLKTEVFQIVSNFI